MTDRVDLSSNLDFIQFFYVWKKDRHLFLLFPIFYLYGLFTFLEII